MAYIKIPTKKLENGFEIPELGIGTSRLSTDDTSAIQSIKDALDLGVTQIDTAEKYAAGHAEELIGDAIKGYDRSKLFLTSKVDTPHLHHDDVIVSANASLKRLGTDYLDLYLIHFPSKDIPLKETMGAMDELVEQGLVKYIGVSNFSLEQLKEAQSYTKNKIVVNQVHYNLKYSEAEKIGLLEYCQDNDILLEAYRPLQKGALLDNPPAIITEMCEKYHKTPAQIYLNWLMSQGNVVTIVKAGDKKHLEENLGSVGWGMAFEDVERLSNEFPGQEKYSDVYPLH